MRDEVDLSALGGATLAAYQTRSGDVPIIVEKGGAALLALSR